TASNGPAPSSRPPVRVMSAAVHPRAESGGAYACGFILPRMTPELHPWGRAAWLIRRILPPLTREGHLIGCSQRFDAPLLAANLSTRAPKLARNLFSGHGVGAQPKHVGDPCHQPISICSAG